MESIIPEKVVQQLLELSKRSDPCAPSSRSMESIIEAAHQLARFGLKIDRAVDIPEGGVILYIFGGEANDRGTHPLHVGIIADNEEEGLVIFLSNIGCDFMGDFFEVATLSEDSLNRISRFLSIGH